MAQYNETQKAHVAFRGRWMALMPLWMLVSFWLTNGLPKVTLPNGEKFPLALPAAMVLYVLPIVVMYVIGRIKFGEEGSLEPKKKNKP